ncbi:MAG: hypothetical protein ACREYF_07425 [Gammaproteobacteria bacterium]
MEHMDATIDEDYEIDAAAQAHIEMLRADYYHQDREDDRFIASMKEESDAMESDERDRLWWLAYGGEDNYPPRRSWPGVGSSQRRKRCG